MWNFKIRIHNHFPFPSFLHVTLETKQIYTYITFLNQGQGKIFPTNISSVAALEGQKSLQKKTIVPALFLFPQVPHQNLVLLKCEQKTIFR